MKMKGRLTKKITPEDVQRILNDTDWNAYIARVAWRISMPKCNFYDGKWAKEHKAICLYWQGWLTRGRALYPKGKQGLQEYLKRLEDIAPEGLMDHKRTEEFLRTVEQSMNIYSTIYKQRRRFCQ
jgi:hypothetical protein